AHRESTASRISCQPSTRGILQPGRRLVPKRGDACADELDRRDHRDRDHRERDRVLREVLPAFIPNQPPGQCHVSPFPGCPHSSAGAEVVRRPKTVGGVLPALALALLVVAAYLPALHAGFIWDDDAYVTANATLRTLDGLRRIWLEPGAVPQYYPLTFTSLWLDHHLWGVQPLGYHLVNVLLHGAN